jgi:hypothetical protein
VRRAGGKTPEYAGGAGLGGVFSAAVTRVGKILREVSIPASTVRRTHDSKCDNQGETPMRTLIATAFVSLDGVVEAPGGEPGHRSSGWTFKDIEFDEAAYEIKGREQEEAAAMMMGRVSYETFSPM